MTDFLFARPSIMEGIGRNIDLFGLMNTYNFSENAEEADIRAFEADIEALRNDFDTVLSNLNAKQKQAK
jgi:hypothetical protein